MDISKEYIDMCNKAIEIQAIRTKEGFHNLEVRDNWFTPHQGEGFISITRNVKEEGWIWLPRQDQLQDMAKKSAYMNLLCISNRFCRVFLLELSTKKVGKDFKLVDENDVLLPTPEFYSNASVFHSLEQMWLAFIMDEVHNKKWDFENKDWISK